MNTNKCPVCGKPGIPNYLTEDVVCPHCGSDLKIYRKVTELSNLQPSTDGSRKFKMLSIVLPMIAIAVTAAICYSLYPKEKSQDAYYTKYIECEKQAAQLNDSVSVLNAQIQNLTTAQDNYIDYVVVKNDSPWKIVYKLYGNRKDWETIAQSIAMDNDIWDEDHNEWGQIHPGQILKIHKAN